MPWQELSQFMKMCEACHQLYKPPIDYDPSDLPDPTSADLLLVEALQGRSPYGRFQVPGPPITPPPPPPPPPDDSHKRSVPLRGESPAPKYIEYSGGRIPSRVGPVSNTPEFVPVAPPPPPPSPPSSAVVPPPPPPAPILYANGMPMTYNANKIPAPPSTNYSGFSAEPSGPNLSAAQFLPPEIRNRGSHAVPPPCTPPGFVNPSDMWPTRREKETFAQSEYSGSPISSFHADSPAPGGNESLSGHWPPEGQQDSPEMPRSFPGSPQSPLRNVPSFARETPPAQEIGEEIGEEVGMSTCFGDDSQVESDHERDEVPGGYDFVPKGCQALGSRVLLEETQQIGVVAGYESGYYYVRLEKQKRLLQVREATVKHHVKLNLFFYRNELGYDLLEQEYVMRTAVKIADDYASNLNSVFPPSTVQRFIDQMCESCWSFRRPNISPNTPGIIILVEGGTKKLQPLVRDGLVEAGHLALASKSDCEKNFVRENTKASSLQPAYNFDIKPVPIYILTTQSHGDTTQHIHVDLAYARSLKMWRAMQHDPATEIDTALYMKVTVLDNLPKKETSIAHLLNHLLHDRQDFIPSEIYDTSLFTGPNVDRDPGPSAKYVSEEETELTKVFLASLTDVALDKVDLPKLLEGMPGQLNSVTSFGGMDLVVTMIFRVFLWQKMQKCGNTEETADSLASFLETVLSDEKNLTKVSPCLWDRVLDVAFLQCLPAWSWGGYWADSSYLFMSKLLGPDSLLARASINLDNLDIRLDKERPPDEYLMKVSEYYRNTRFTCEFHRFSSNEEDPGYFISSQLTVKKPEEFPTHPLMSLFEWNAYILKATVKWTDIRGGFYEKCFSRSSLFRVELFTEVDSSEGDYSARSPVLICQLAATKDLYETSEIRVDLTVKHAHGEPGQSLQDLAKAVYKGISEANQIKATLLATVLPSNRSIRALSGLCGLSKCKPAPILLTQSHTGSFFHPRIRSFIWNEPHVAEDTPFVNLSESLPNIIEQAPLHQSLKARTAKLDESQQKALQVALSRKISIIKGPPGTGKTEVSAMIIWYWLAHLPKDTYILVASESNTGAENIFQRMTQICPAATDHLEHVVRFRRGTATTGQGYYYKTKDEVNSVMIKAKVVFTTCVGSGLVSNFLETRNCHFLLGDECSQSRVASYLIPLSQGAQHICLVGDEKQLGPVFKPPEDEEQPSIFDTFLEQLQHRQPDAIQMLTYQRRMHSSIAAFPSQQFYAGALRNGLDDSQISPIDGFPWPANSRSCMVSMTYTEAQKKEMDGRVRSNPLEADAIASLVTRVVEHGLEASQIVVISPYRAQTQLLSKKLEGLMVKVATVDSFQGQEADLIIFSSTRWDEKPGFLVCPRRINVLMTRARRGFIAFGHVPSLQTVEVWSSFFNWSRQNQSMIPLNTLNV